MFIRQIDGQMILDKDSRVLGVERFVREKFRVRVQWIQGDLYGGQGDKRGEGFGGDGGDSIVIEGQQFY